MPIDYDSEGLDNTGKYSRKITRLFNQMAQEAALLGVSINAINPDRIFSFDDYPKTKKAVNKLLQSLRTGLETIIVNGVRSSWTLSNNKNNELARRVFGNNVGKLSQNAYRRYFTTNAPAREAFEKRKLDGLSISDRVWRYSKQFKAEIEMGLDIGIGGGLPAQKMASELKQYLQDPDKLFRRVRDKHGNLKLSKKAAAYHPGQGVYRSSYKNAMRLARTETNMAYRAADDARWATMDFVVGYEIKVSNNPNHCPMCFSLQGKYPKNYKWDGWHAQCRCRKIPILKTIDELEVEKDAIFADEDVSNYSVNAVDGLPKSFNDWYTVNKDRLVKAQKKPNWMGQNEALLVFWQR